jgi:hypothetical protein
MERRSSERIKADLGAEIILNNINYPGKIENISDEGLFVKVLSEDLTLDFHPGTIFKLIPELPSGKEICLECRVVWSEKDSIDGVTDNLGLRILETTPEYDEFVKSLYMSNTGIF